MTLYEWSKLRQRSLFETGCYSVARAVRRGRVQWFVLFTNPLPHWVRIFKTVDELADVFGSSPDQITGTIFTEQEELVRLR